MSLAEQIIHMVFTTEGLFELATESWFGWI